MLLGRVMGEKCAMMKQSFMYQSWIVTEQRNRPPRRSWGHTRTKSQAPVESKPIFPLGDLKGLHFLPLGGCGEIGMNANFYCCDGQWLMVDNGITFSRVPESVLMTDIRGFLAGMNQDLSSLQGLVITHAHEDHVGAAGYLWPYLRCPIYATPFTAYILRQKLAELGPVVRGAEVTEIPLDGTLTLGHFQMQFVSLTHSIPEPNALVIKTPHGTIFHTGDWKIDPEPVIGPVIEAQTLQTIGDDGVLALVCDSTNVFEPGTAGSEGQVRQVLQEVISQCPDRAILSCFSSNVARVDSCYAAGVAAGRKVCLIGRSLERMVDAARHCGYWPAERTFIRPEQIKDYPSDKILILTTGSQAEPAAALTRMSLGTHPHVKLTDKDTVIFSSRVIPGNQEAISALQNRLVMLGANIIKYRDGLHVSGHPCQDELAQMYEWLRPKIVVPVHGEDIHIHEQARFARTCGVPFTLTPHNGQLFRLSGPEPIKVGEVETGRLALDGKRVIKANGDVVRGRCELLNRGMLTVNLVISYHQCRIMHCMMSSHGVFEYLEERELMEEKIQRVIREAFDEVVAYHKQKAERNAGQESVSETPENAAGAKTKRRRTRVPGVNDAVEYRVSDLFRREWKAEPVVRITSAWV